MKNFNSIKKQIKFFLLMTLMISFSIPITFRIKTVLAQERKDLSDIAVGIYDYYGIIGSDDTSIAVYNMFSWMNATVDVISLYRLLEHGLSNYDIFVIPGGSCIEYNEDIGEQGKEIIRNYVKNGGSYFGICGGAHFGTENYLNLYHGGYINPPPGIESPSEMVIMNVNKDSLWLDLTNIPSSLTTIYLNGGCFDNINVYYKDNMHIIAEYSQNNMPGMVAIKVGRGSAFLCGPHPEIEEESDRDGLSMFDHFYDPDSEWDLILKVSLWLVNPLRPIIHLVRNIIGLAICGAILILPIVQKYIKKGFKKDNHGKVNSVTDFNKNYFEKKKKS